MSNPEEIRQKAYALLERVGGPDNDDDSTTWPEEPSLRRSLDEAEEDKEARESKLPPSSYQNTPQKVRILRREEEEEEKSSEYMSENDRIGGLVGFFLQCVSDACKASSNMLTSTTGYYDTAAEVPKLLVRTGYGAIHEAGEQSESLLRKAMYRDERQQQSKSETSFES
jgi:hypothetical protein